MELQNGCFRLCALENEVLQVCCFTSLINRPHCLMAYSAAECIFQLQHTNGLEFLTKLGRLLNIGRVSCDRSRYRNGTELYTNPGPKARKAISRIDLWIVAIRGAVTSSNFRSDVALLILSCSRLLFCWSCLFLPLASSVNVATHYYSLSFNVDAITSR